jgi:hypothetical protein
VEGTGADVDAVPPVGLVPYQYKVLPVSAVADNAGAFTDWQYSSVLFPTMAGAATGALTITLISTRALSQPFNVWLTKYEVVAAAEVVGVGVVPRALPPDAAAYHFSPVPFALKVAGVWLKQYVIVEAATVGAGVTGFTVTLISVFTDSQLFRVCVTK